MNNAIDRIWGILLIFYGVSIFVFPTISNESSSGRGNLLWNPFVGIVSIGFGIYYLFIKKVVTDSDNSRLEDDNKISVNTDLIVIELPFIISPIERSEKFDNKLNNWLKIKNIGFISGGGTPIGDYIGLGSSIDVSCKNALVSIIEILNFMKESGYPIGSTIRFNEIIYKI